MNTYVRYLLVQLTLPTLFALLAFSGAVWLSQSLRFVDLIVNRGLPLSTFLYLTLLLLPSLLLVVLPFALFCAVLFVYQRLSAESEIGALKAAGLSDLQLAAPGMLLATVVTLLAYAISLYFMPVAFRSFKDLQHEIRQDASHMLLQEGVFNAPVDDVTVYVRSRAGDGSLKGILVHDTREPGRPVTMTSERGDLVRGEDGLAFVLHAGSRQELDGASGELSVLYFDRYVLDFANADEAPVRSWRKPKELFLPQLLNPAPDVTPAKRRELLTEAHQRLTVPLNALTFALIAMATLLPGTMHRRSGRGPVLLAVALALAVQIATVAVANVAERTFAVAPLLYLIPLSASALALLRLSHRLPAVRALQHA